MLTALTAYKMTNITQSDTVNFDPPLKMLQVFPPPAGGVIELETDEGETVTFTVPAVTTSGSNAPFCIVGSILRVNATNTTLADATMVGFF